MVRARQSRSGCLGPRVDCRGITVASIQVTLFIVVTVLFYY